MSGTRDRRTPLRLLALSALSALTFACSTPHYSADGPDWGLKPAPAEVPASGRPVPPGSFEGVPTSLLNEYASREALTQQEASEWELPFKAKRIIVGLLIAAGHDSYDDLDMFFTEDARWGFPDRRELDTFPIFDRDGGARFVEAFRQVASRFGAKATFTCPPMVDATTAFVRSGAETYWCWYMSNDNLDVLAFKLVTEKGHGRIDYVGMYPQRPTGPVPIRSEKDDRSPPMSPPVKRRGLGDAPPMRISPTPPELLGGAVMPLPIAGADGVPVPGSVGAPGVTGVGLPPAGAPTGAPPTGAPAPSGEALPTPAPAPTPAE
ncbi:MAG: hypothetical protein R3A79_02915 [Nannocystaceae bacterium]